MHIAFTRMKSKHCILCMRCKEEHEKNIYVDSHIRWKDLLAQSDFTSLSLDLNKWDNDCEHVLGIKAWGRLCWQKIN